MDQHDFSLTNRRQFLTFWVPACAAISITSAIQPVHANETGSDTDQNVHLFDKPFERELTIKDFFAVRYGEFINLAEALEQEWGRDKLVAFLKKNTEQRNMQFGQQQAREFGDNSLSAYVKQFRPPNYTNRLTHEIVQDTDDVFEMRVTECIWAKTFRDADAGDIGYAHICYGDYSWTSGFNPKMKMVRDKTLMQGHDCCNHCYMQTS